MNIYLRDSKTLQEAIHTRMNKKQLPKVQLHPDLQNGIVDCEREGFVVRTEQLFGEQKGEPNQTDVQNMAAFLPAPASCTASWKIVTIKQGDSMVNIPSELIFDFADKGKLVVRTQSVADVTRLSSTLATDRMMRFDASLIGGVMTFAKDAGEKPKFSSGLSLLDLQSLAPHVGVTWDKTASNEINIERIQAALSKKGEKVDKSPLPVKKPV